MGGEQAQSAHEGLDWHHQRAHAEHVHKALHHGVGREPRPGGESGAQAGCVRLGGLADHVVIGVHRLACPASWAPQPIATGRGTRVPVAGRMLRPAGPGVWRLVLDADALAGWRNLRPRGGARGVATCRDGVVATPGGKRGGPGAGCLHVPVSDGHSTTGAGHTGSPHSAHEKNEGNS